MPGRPEVLLVGHDASRTGAPVLALTWLRWAVAAGTVDVAVSLDRGGPLRADFERTCATEVRDGPVDRAVRTVSPRLRSSAAIRVADSASHPRAPWPGPPIVVANTVAAWRSAAAVRRRRRLVLWVHELDHVAGRIVMPRERARLLASTDHLIAVGAPVGEMLVARWGVAPRQVTVIDSFTGTPAADEPPAAGSHDVVGIGSLTPRKGPDAFVAVVAALRQARPDLRAAWIGGPLEGDTADLVRHDRATAGLTHGLELVGEVDDAVALLPPTGVLVHTAREDPAPLAVLEAAIRAVPVVTWDTGGAADLLRSAGLGHLVAAPGDVLGIARQVQALLADPRARAAAGAALREAALTRSTERLAPEVLRAVLGAPP